MNTDAGARQFFDLVVPELMMGVNIRNKPTPTKAEIRQRGNEAVDCFLHGYDLNF
jgi:hypothetical protein